MSVEVARAGLRRWAAMDPSAWDTGLSPAGARRALAEASEAVLAADLQRLLPADRLFIPPRELLIWCSSNVFTAPLEWTAAFVALGSRVTLKAPSASPASTLALAEAFGESVRALARPHAEAWELIAQADAVLGFGSDRAMAELSAHLPPGLPRSLHGHKVSFALVEGHGEALAQALALDAALYDGQGCMSPAAVLCTGDAQALAQGLHRALQALHTALPRGPLPPELGHEWRRRRGLALALGALYEGDEHAVAVLPPEHLGAASLPRFLVVHPVERGALPALLRGLPLSTLATDLEDPHALSALGFTRVCRPGFMQRPPFPRPHDGVDVLHTLCKEVSREC